MSDSSFTANIFYYPQTGGNLKFNYNCNTSELLLGVTNQQQYEVFCSPVYHTNQTFIAPKEQDSGTILCKKQTDNYLLGITWAVPCNHDVECDDERDEFGCQFPVWLIPSLLSGAGAVLIATLFVYLCKSIKSTWKKKMQYRNTRFPIQRQHISVELEKSYRMAVLIENGDVDKIHEMYCQELENHGGEGEATCYLKVMEHLIEPKSIELSSFITK